MNNFDESKHPRDGDGKFTDKGGESSKGGEAKRIFELAEKYGIEYNRDTSYQTLKARVENEETRRKRISSLSKQEWAQYYKILGDERHGDFVYKMKDGKRAIRLENKIVFDNGDFENPIVENILQFKNNDDMNDWLNESWRNNYND